MDTQTKKDEVVLADIRLRPERVGRVTKWLVFDHTKKEKVGLFANKLQAARAARLYGDDVYLGDVKYSVARQG